ncbi:MAG: NAD(P)/FAD-dependent oxidoreductase, partial [Archaeoglobaceae archaeon]
RFKGYKALLENKEVEFNYLIGADGVNSEVARAFGFKKPRVFTALQMETRFEAIDEKFVEIYLGNAYSEFFAYAIPIGDTARIGVIAKKNAILYLKNLIEKHPSVSKRFKGSIVEINSGVIPAELVDFVKDRVALIGDSAGMVKSYTGGGLYYLLIAAEKLAKNFPDLNAYRKDFLKEVGREIKIGKIIRKIYQLSDSEIEGVVKGLKDFDFSRMHMDYPSKIFSMENFKELLKVLAKNPSLFRIILKILFKS